MRKHGRAVAIAAPLSECNAQVTVPYLRSEYGKEYDFDAPVKLLDAMMHEQAQASFQRVVVLGQVLAADINIGYEEIVNTRVSQICSPQSASWLTRLLLESFPFIAPAAHPEQHAYCHGAS